VVRADPFYKSTDTGILNTTNGSCSDPFYHPEIPPTAVGGLFRSLLPNARALPSGNPTNGSWWIVQILSTQRTRTTIRESHQRQLVGFHSPSPSAVVERIRTIHQLPLVGFISIAREGVERI